MSSSNPSTGPLSIVVVPAAVTLLVYVPELVTDAGQMAEVPAPVRWAELAILLCAAPAVAAVIARRARVRVDDRVAVVAGLAQLALAVLLVRIDVWIEVRSGYLLAGSGEEAMAYGLGTIASVVGGLLLATLVGLAARAGTRLAPTP